MSARHNRKRANRNRPAQYIDGQGYRKVILKNDDGWWD